MCTRLILTVCLTIFFFVNNISCNSFPEINGATKGQPCDLDLYNTYLVPMYQAITRTIFIQGFNNLSLHLNQTPGLESKSCFSYTHADPTQNAPEKYRYLQCRAVTGQSEPSCECSNEEPYLSTSTPSGSCRVVSPSIGSPCKPFRTKVMNQDFYYPFRSKIDYAKKAEDIQLAFKDLEEGFRKYRVEHFLHSDIRRACYNNNGIFGDKQNPESLECSDNGQCVCVTYGERFRYAPVNGRCEAERNSVCKITFRGTSGTPYTFVDVHCAQPDTSCRDVPIPGIPQWVTVKACLPNTGDVLQEVGLIILAFLPASKIIPWLLGLST